LFQKTFVEKGVEQNPEQKAMTRRRRGRSGLGEDQNSKGWSDAGAGGDGCPGTGETTIAMGNTGKVGIEIRPAEGRTTEFRPKWEDKGTIPDHTCNGIVSFNPNGSVANSHLR
jgi:hypothetical protein